MNHIDKCLQKASECEKQGDKKMAEYFLNLARRFEEGFKGIREEEIERAKDLNKRR